MKRDIEQLKTDMREVRDVNRRIVSTLVRLEGKFDDMADRMVTKDEFNSFKNVVNNRFDDFTADIQAARRDRALHSDSYMAHQKRLDDHEKRLKRIETSKS